MAFSLRFSGIGPNRAELFRMEPTWWSIPELGKLITLNWVKANETGSYSDDDADISASDARLLHEKFKPAILMQIAYNVSRVERAGEKLPNMQLVD